VADNTHIEAVRRMQHYIESHLREPITLIALAREAGYSPWYSAKIFKELTDKSPFDYIRKLRLSEAAKIMRDEQVKVLDVALDFVFDSHEGFTRAFSKNFGINPKKYMQQTPPIGLFVAYPVVASYKSYLEGDVTVEKETSMVFSQVIEKPARKLILKRGIRATEYFAYCEEIGCDVWGILSSVKEALGEPLGLWLPKALRIEGTSEYVQGVEVPADYNGVVPEGFDLIDLPVTRMMVFQGEPFEDELFGEAIGILRKAIDRYDPKLYGFNWKEEGIKFQMEPWGYRGYIEGRELKD